MHQRGEIGDVVAGFDHDLLADNAACGDDVGGGGIDASGPLRAERRARPVIGPATPIRTSARATPDSDNAKSAAMPLRYVDRMITS
jgi:hypothetical protein